MYDALMALRPTNLSLNAWTVKAGVGRSIFTEIRRHGNPTSETLGKLLDAIGASRADLEAMMHGAGMVRTEVARTGMSVQEVERIWKGAPRQKPLPVVGTAIGIEEYDEAGQVETIELHMAEVFDYIPRPPSVEHDPLAYAVTIVGNSMWPRFKPGERAVVSPRMAASIGDDVIVQLRAPGEEDMADRVTMVLIKELVRKTAKFIELRQYKPDISFTVPIERIKHIHRVATRI